MIIDDFLRSLFMCLLCLLDFERKWSPESPAQGAAGGYRSMYQIILENNSCLLTELMM